MTNINQEIERAYSEGYTKGRVDEAKTCAGCSDRSRKDSEGTKSSVQRYQMGYADGREEVREMVKELPTSFPVRESDEFDAGYNQAKSDLTALLEKKTL